MLLDLDARRILPRVLPLAIGLVVLAAAAALGPELPPLPAGGLALLTGLVLGGALAALHAPLGGGTLALGTAMLPAADYFFGTALAAGGSAVAFGLARLGRRAVTPRRLRESSAPWIAETLTGSGRVLLGAVAAGLAWREVLALGDGAPRSLVAGSAAAGAYLLVVAGLLLAETVASGAPRPWRRVLAPLALDGAGWPLGFALLAAAIAAGWGPALLLLAAVGALAFEAARLRRLRDGARAKVRELRELTLAGHRIIIRNPDLHSIAEQIHFECRRVLPFTWLHFELLRAGDGSRSWWAGPDQKVHQGTPEPPPTPPVLPGIHRRERWRLVVRELAVEDEDLATLRFWCDPRRIEAESLELLDALLPQMASAIQRALLDRVAKRDPLTDLPDRRALESRLEDAFAASREGGTPMAVIMTDVDNFKQINDREGHATGDRVAVLVARLLETHRRERDLCCRYGGDEFALVLEGADGEAALAIGERLRLAVARHPKAEFGTRVPVRLTVGVAAFPELHVTAASELVELADEALYEAKRRGRNRCLLHLGRGRFQTPEGAELEDRKQPPPKPPTLFG